MLSDKGENNARADPTGEQKAILKSLEDSPDSQTIKKAQIAHTLAAISEQMGVMTMKEVRNVEQEWTNSRKSRRLQGEAPEMPTGTGSRVEDNRLIFGLIFSMYVFYTNKTKQFGTRLNTYGEK